MPTVPPTSAGAIALAGCALALAGCGRRGDARGPGSDVAREPPAGVAPAALRWLTHYQTEALQSVQ